MCVCVCVCVRARNPLPFPQPRDLSECGETYNRYVCGEKVQTDEAVKQIHKVEHEMINRRKEEEKKKITLKRDQEINIIYIQKK